MQRTLKLLVTLLSISALVFGATGTFTVGEKIDSDTRIDFTLGEYSTMEIEGTTRILAKNAGNTVDQGMPELPNFSTMFQMEPGISYEVAYNVTRSSILENVEIYPFQEVTREKEDTEIVHKNIDFYNSSQSYPVQNLSVEPVAVMRGLELLPISFIPFRYHAETRELEIFEEVEIHVYETGERELTLANSMPPSRAFEQLYKSVVVNYEPDRTEEYQSPAILYICGGGSETHPAFLQLVDWRHKRGYVVYVAGTDETGSSNNNIKAYIQDAYEDYNPPPEFVGLVGDVGGSFNIPNWQMNSGDSDHPYTQLDGGDLLPEVLIGRLSVSGSTELNVVVSKTLNYEQATFLSNNWLEKAALVGDPSSSGLSTIITNEYIENTMENWGFEDVRTRFSGPFPSWMEDQLEEGIAYFNYRGYISTSGFSASNINNANNGHMTPFVTFITCATGSYGYGTAISESFIRAGTVNNPKGGVAAIGTATASTHTAPNNIVDMGVYAGIFSQGVETGAGALFAGKLALYNTYPTNPNSLTAKFTAWNNLMGDPALHLWTDTPMAIVVDFPAEVGIGSNYIPVTVTDEDGNPVEDAIVTAVSNYDDIFVSIYTDENGLALIPLDPEFSGDVDLTVTKRNVIPFTNDFEVVDTGAAVNIVADGIVIDDAAGNSDGMLNSGENVFLTIPLFNYGTVAAENVQAYIEASSDLITIISSSMDYGTMEPGGSASAVFEISVDAAAVDMDELGLVIYIMENGADSWSSLLPVEVHGGKLMFDEYHITSGYLTHGNSCQLSVDLKNLGSVEMTGITAEVVFVPNLLELSNTTLYWGDIGPGSSGTSTSSFSIDASGDIVNGSIYSLELYITTDEGYSRMEYMPVQVGNISVLEPLGPDAHGYYIYDSEDLGYNLALPYDWFEIDPDFGGNGTSLGMSDNGNGTPQGQQSAHVDLPFIFTFYGVDYDEITISTNGWIGFGDSELESFRNYPLPGAGGPSPMLAVFWDDLKTANGGQVYKYIDPNNQYVVIEWSGMVTYDENSSETFQAILYDSLTPTGDDEILLQYKDFNNTSNGNYQSYTPIHGCYATIGIENHLGNIGLQYTFDDEYPLAAMELSDETALFITTQQPLALMLGDVNQDGEINVSDIVMAVNHALNVENGGLGPLQTYIADMNQDGNVNILDVILMINAILFG